MKEIAIQIASAAVNDQRIAHVVGVGAIGAGKGLSWFGMTSLATGDLVTLLGMILTATLIANHALKFFLKLISDKIDNRLKGLDIKKKEIDNDQKEVDLEISRISLAKLKKEANR